MTSNAQLAHQISKVFLEAHLQMKGWAGIQAGRIAIVVDEQKIDELSLMQVIRQTERLLSSQVVVIRSNNLSPAESRKMQAQFSALDI